MPNFLGIRAIWNRSSVISFRVLNTCNRNFKRGFTIIELVVITAVIALITGLILVSDSTFGGKILLENLAYDMALSIREAQVYGISVQRFGTGTFGVAYGVHFDTSSQYNYITFADACGTENALYNAPNVTCSAGETVSSASLERGFRISKLCVPAGTDSATCTSVNPLDITFKRPEPDACFSPGGVSDLNVALQCKNTYSNARIVLNSPRGDVASIVIESNGQITVQKQ